MSGGVVDVMSQHSLQVEQSAVRPSASRAQGRYWCFTLNNPRAGDADGVWELSGEVSYACVGYEVSPGGTPHLQGYVEFPTNQRLGALHTTLGRAHWERRKGSASQAALYCQKDGIFFESGTISVAGQGTRVDLTDIREAILNGANDVSIANEWWGQWLRYHRSFSRYRLLAIRPPAEQRECFVYWGLTGAGKSHRAHEENPQAYWAVRSSGGHAWFDGYNGESCVVFDDFYSWIPYDLVLRLLDRYPVTMQRNGGAVVLRATKIVFTSNTDPYEWYPNIGDRAALHRRLRAATIVHYPFAAQF